ncbi:MAG TPA: FHA domain-containing protein, partial [Thermoanaerobaculia bacterium]|nr:FHA domain-containing protein [Thermoanaerobaculia bacterium]
SKAHARLERSGLQLVVIDLQSSNATFVNGERIDSKALADGDEISLGGGRTYRVRIDKGPIEIGEESQISAPTTAAKPVLPTDWKTRIEWSPEEKEVFDGFVKGSVERGKTVPRPAVEDKSAAAKPPAAPPPQAKAAPAEPVRKPAAPKEVSLPAPPKPPPPKEISLPTPPKPLAPREVSLPAPPKPAAPKEVSLPTPPKPAAPREVLLPTPPKPAAPSPSPPPVSAAAPPASSPEPAKKPPAPPSPPPSAQSARPAPAAQSAPSRRVSLEGKTERFAVGLGDHDVGRLPQCPIYIQGPQISRRHAVLRVTAGAVVIEDLRSANGTFVNGKKITGQHPLANDDHVQFGDTGFRVRIGS